MSNIVTVNPKNSRLVKLGSLQSGSFCEWDHRIYVVVARKESPNTVAVSLFDGGWLSADAMVEVIPRGTIITVEVA